MMTPEQVNEYVDARIDARMEQIADLAAKKALEKVCAEVGLGVLRKASWFLGVLILTILSWMAGKGMRLPSP